MKAFITSNKKRSFLPIYGPILSLYYYQASIVHISTYTKKKKKELYLSIPACCLKLQQNKYRDIKTLEAIKFGQFRL